MTKRNFSFLVFVVLMPLLTYAFHGRSEALRGVDPRITEIVENTVSVQSVSSTIAAQAVSTSTNAQIVRVIDGDTLFVRLDGKASDEKIRLLGINTPEVVDPRKPVECFGKEASAHMHQLVDGKRVRLESDPMADERDKYGRLLRNLFLEDGAGVNALVVQGGSAYACLS